MSLTVTLGPLWVFDEGDGAGRAEPYIWPVFYKIDEEAVDWILFPDGRPEPPWFITPGGSHHNLPSVDAGDRLEVVRTHTFPTFTPLEPIPDESAVGFVVVLLEEDTVPSDAQINAAYELFASTVREKIIETINERIAAFGSGGEDSTSQNIAETLRDKLSSEVWRALWLNLGLNPLLAVVVPQFVDRDDVVGPWSRIIKLADLPRTGSFRRYGPVMWSSANGSEDGRYALQARIDRTP